MTVDHEASVSADVVDEILPTKALVSRVAKTPTQGPILSRLRYGTNEWNAVDIPACIKKLKSVLRSYDRPILISRCNPAMSAIVAWYCRDLAYRWIAHFSDPFPWAFGDGLRMKLQRAVLSRWGRRVISDADAISVTCPNVLRFFSESYGDLFTRNEQKFFVLTHIGEPFISPPNDEALSLPLDMPILSHVGNFPEQRFSQNLAEELLELANSGFCFRFIQAGYIPEFVEKRFSDNGAYAFERVQLRDPRSASELFLQSDINLTIDLDVGSDYIPFLPSKFVYQLFSDRPILAYTRADSPMAQLASEYKEAGVFFADVDRRGDLAKVVREILALEKQNFDRDEIRKRYLKKTIRETFLDRVRQILD